MGDDNTALDFLEGVACPTCQGKVVRTREGVLFCQICCVGYPTHGEVPDFRQSSAIDFKKLIRQNRSSGVTAKIQCLGSVFKKTDSKISELKVEQCLLVGRAVFLEPDSDITFVGVPQEHKVSLGNETRQLIEQYLVIEGKAVSDIPPLHPHQYLGHYSRVDDLLIDDKSVSRAHAVFYNAPDGLWVLDLVSKNGTYVGGREVEHIKLKHNDVITLGSVNFRVMLR